MRITQAYANPVVEYSPPLGKPVPEKPRAATILFSNFALDLASGELSQNGKTVVRLTEQLFRLLVALLEHPGEVVTREDLRHQLWPDNTVVDFEHSINTGIKRLRQTLGDSGDDPQYIETLARRGYRWKVPVEWRDSVLPSSSFLITKPEPAGSSLTGEKAAHYRILGILRGNAMSVSSTWAKPAIAVLAAVLLLALGSLWESSRTRGRTVDRREGRAAVPRQVAGAGWLFVLNEKGHSVSIVNPLTNSAESTLSVSADPRGAAILPNGALAYISLNGANQVVAMNTRTHEIVASIPVGNNPVGVAANPRPPFVYVANNYSNTVSVIDSTTNAVVREISVGAVPTEVVVNSDGTRAIVTNQSSGTVTVIDSVANSVLATIPVGTTPVGAAFTPDSKFAWVTLAGQREVAILDVATLQVVNRIPAGAGPLRVAIGHDGRRALVSNFFSNTVTVIDTASLQSMQTIAVGRNPVGLGLEPAGDLAYVANYGSNSISVIDMNSLTVTGIIDVGVQPVEMAVLPCFVAPCDGQRRETESSIFRGVDHHEQEDGIAATVGR